MFRPAIQSSTYEDAAGLWEAERAVDGKDVGDRFTSSTDTNDDQPWWKVHLAYAVWVSFVEITNYDGE